VSQNLLAPFGLENGYQKHPAVSPDGKKIVFAANKDGNWNLYLQENGITTQLTRNPAHEIYPVWSPNEDILAFVSTQSGTEQIWVLELSSGKIEQLTGLDR
jgi:TolB protein